MTYRKRPATKTKAREIANYWKAIRPVDEQDLNFDWSDCETVCWGCGKDSKSLQVCHIIPASLDGEDAPHNLVLLCCWCHEKCPDVADAAATWQWLKDQKHFLLCSYASPKFMATMGVLADLCDSDTARLATELLFNKALRMTSIHAGIGRKISTMEWVIDKTLEWLTAALADGQTFADIVNLHPPRPELASPQEAAL